MYGGSWRFSGSRLACSMPSVRNLPIICSTSTCLCIVAASTIAAGDPAALRELAMNDSTTGACGTSAAPPFSSSKYSRHSGGTRPGSAR